VRPVSVRPVSVSPVSVHPVSVCSVNVRPVSVRPVSVCILFQCASDRTRTLMRVHCMQSECAQSVGVCVQSECAYSRSVRTVGACVHSERACSRNVRAVGVCVQSECAYIPSCLDHPKSLPRLPKKALRAFSSDLPPVSRLDPDRRPCPIVLHSPMSTESP
jgi:hypothetical protein